MPQEINGRRVPLLEAIKTHPEWAETRIRFLEHALHLMEDTIRTCLYALNNIDDVEFNPKTTEESPWDGD